MTSSESVLEGHALELIAKLEAATEGSRELDAEIALAVGHEGTGIGGAFADVVKNYPNEIGRIGDFHNVPHYTTSIDAALTLVPSGYQCDLSIYAPHCAWARIGGTETFGKADNKPAALALCISALKACNAKRKMEIENG